MIDYANIIDIIFTVVALMFTVISHEIAHGYVALLNGDDTAKKAGRLSFNPIKHIDLVGLLFLIVFKFGWAKPVPIDERNFKDRRKGLFLVSIAGVTVNFITAVVSIFIIVFSHNKLGIFNDLFLNLATYGLFFCVFNLLPIPPLDGSKILASFLPIQFEYYIYKYERYFYLLLIGFLLFNRSTGFISSVVFNLYFLLVKFATYVLGLL